MYCFHWKHKQLEGVLSVHGGSLSYKGICQIQNWYVILKGENLGFHLDINLSASLENILSYTQPYIHIYFSLHTVLYCFHWEHRQLEEVLRAHGGSLRYEWIGHIQNVYVILKGGETRLSVGYKFIGLPWKLLKLYPSLQSYFFFFLHTVLYCFHWKHKQLEGLLKCTRMLFKLWRNWPNSKCICYSERGEPRLSFGYKFVGIPWKLLKLYPS